jgi:hypothetical protein
MLVQQASEQRSTVMRSIAAGAIGLLLTTGVAAAQTPAERDAILRGFQQRAAEYSTQHQCLDMFPEALSASAPAPQLFTPPVAMVFRQLIAQALATVDTATAMRGSGMPGHRAHVLDPLPADATGFPPVLAKVLPALPAGLDYRLVDNDLVVRDQSADVVVAVLRNAVGVAALK